MFEKKNGKNAADNKENSKVESHSSADSRYASGDFGGHALNDSLLERAYGGVNTSAQVKCTHCGSINVKSKLKTIGVNGAVYSHECTVCGNKWETVDASTSI